jgi:hypothetical protein
MSHSSQTKRRRSPLEIRKLLSRFHSSALSRTEFVQAEGLCLSTLRRYLSAQRVPAAPASRKTRAHTFFELEPPPPSPPASPSRAAYRLLLKSDLVLEVPGGFCGQEVAVLLSLLSNVSSR